MIELLLTLFFIMLIASGQTVCFNDPNDYSKFKLENENKTDYQIVFPCSELDLSKIPEDVSNQ